MSGTCAADFGSGRFARLARKELAEILRDRRTMLTLVLMPLLLYPLMSVVLGQLLLSSSTTGAEPVYRLGFQSKAEMQSLTAYLALGEASLEDRGAFKSSDKNTRPDAVVRPKLEVFDFDDFHSEVDLEGAVARGEIDVGLRMTLPGAFRVDPRNNLNVDLELMYREDSDLGLEAEHYVERLCREGNSQFLAGRLHSLRISQRAEAVRPRPVALRASEGRRTQFFAVLLPLVLILMTITGAVYPAIDLTAGERERGTLEVLIAAPVPRWALLAAKYVAVVSVAVLTALVNLGAMTLTLWASPMGMYVLDSAKLSPWLVLQVFALLLLLAAFFSAVLLAITSNARSFKEAQAYLIPLMLASLMPGMVGFVPSLTLHGPLAVVPLVNIVLLARDLVDGIASPVTAAVVVLTTGLYAVAAIAVAARTFGAEAVLYAQQGGWGEWLRRPRESQPAASASGALLCLALMFPTSFVLNGLLGSFKDSDITTVLAAQGLSTVALFGGFPLIAAWLGRIRPLSGFRLKKPGVQACLAALLLGLCLWPLVHEMDFWLRRAGVASLTAEQMKAAEKAIDQMRSVPAPLVVFVLSVLTPILEELFFRGYLLSALMTSSRPRTAILTSAALFGVFHLIAGGGLAIERLVPSTVLGAVLGWICWKSGSVVPGMLLHVAHNSLLLLLGLNEPTLQKAGWSLGAAEHLPAGLLIGAAVGTAIGILWMNALRQAADESLPTLMD